MLHWALCQPGLLQLSTAACLPAAILVDFPKMTLCLLFLLFLCAFADEVSILDHLKTSKTLQLAANCPPLFYGLNCEIPHCFPEHGHLSKRGLDDYYCNCTKDYALGKHCEIIDCHYGNLSTTTLKCKCPYYASGRYCQQHDFKTLGFILAVIGLAACVTILAQYYQNANSDNIVLQYQAYCNAQQSLPTPEIRVVERVVIQERSDAPPGYDSACQ